MKQSFKLLLALSLLALAITVKAAGDEESSRTGGKTTVKQSELKSEKKKADIDDEITNARMRAETGSKSKWSIKTAFNVNGGSIERPFGKVRPNIMNGNATETRTALGGSVSVKYGITKNDSISVGAGVSLLEPFHTQAEDIDTNGQFDNPSIDYSRAYKLGQLQMVTSGALTAFTSDTARAYSYQGGLNLGQNVLYGMENGLTLGCALDLNWYSFDDNAADRARFTRQTNGNLGQQQDSSDVGLYPYLEYAFNDRYSLRTVFRYAVLNHNRAESDPWTYYKTVNSQSVGVGISVYRDLYLYPNVQFIPGDLKSDRTNVALSANINVF